MSRSYEVLWAAIAERDLLEIVEYVSADDPVAAVETLGKIEAATTTLARSPRRGRVVPELMENGVRRYREIVVRPWRAIYRIEGEKVYVVAVFDGRRNVEDLLLARLLR